jgi:cysteine desulfurase/selenocysteine lyase
MTLTADAATELGGRIRDGKLDAEVIRRDFPVLQQEVHGKPLVFLDSASTSQKPQPVIDALDAYYAKFTANVHRGIYEIGARATA